MQSRIRSFVIRHGRLTPAQNRALDELAPRYVFDLNKLFYQQPDRYRPVCLEIGIGNGENLIAQAAEQPDWNFIGCEVHRPGLGHALLLADAAKLNNVCIAEMDVIDLLAKLPAGSLDAVNIFFPDPWPKKRHHKRRLLSHHFLLQLASTMKAHGRLHFATDDADYAEQAVAAASAASAMWWNPAGAGQFSPRYQQRVITRFERRAIQDQRKVFDMLLCRNGSINKP